MATFHVPDINRQKKRYRWTKFLSSIFSFHIIVGNREPTKLHHTCYEEIERNEKERGLGSGWDARRSMKDLQTVVQRSVAMPLQCDGASHNTRGQSVKETQGSMSGEQYLPPA